MWTRPQRKLLLIIRKKDVEDLDAEAQPQGILMHIGSRFVLRQLRHSPSRKLKDG